MSGHVLVTGSSGFVGGALGRWLRRAGWRVTGLSRSPPRPEACDAFVAHDLAASPPVVEGALDAIVHCAAMVAPWGRPADYEAANIAGLGNVLRLAAEKRPSRFVFLSSSSVHYAYEDQLGLTEDSPWPITPANAYAETKRRGEAMVKASGLPYAIVRPRAVFGPGDTVVFPRILRAARRGVLPILVRRDKVTPVTDLLYIDNLCWWIEQALVRGAGGVYLLTNGEPIETPKLLAEVLAGLDLPPARLKVPVDVAMAAAGAMELASRTVLNWREPLVTRFGILSLAYSKTFDISKARRDLGRPPVPLAAGLERFMAWQASGAANP
jgi:nucleoside-diphosphate-sugar epimerase